MSTNAGQIQRKRFQVTGVVQGVGFRPYVYAIATQLGLTGFVRNDSSGVTIEVEGDIARLAEFEQSLQRDAPPLAHVEGVHVEDVPTTGLLGFRITPSELIESVRTNVAPDVATCADCLREMNDPSNRRYRYPFINCTNCGPRYTIIRDVPYDRSLTTMSDFVMCERCKREYSDPSDRRYHAQPNACWDCGPAVWFVQGAAVDDRNSFEHKTWLVGDSAIQAFHRAIAEGQIVAVKGIGGMHLACSALNSLVIETLRTRKGRIDKPLAIMVQDIESARRIAFMSQDEERLLQSLARPIVLLRRRPDLGLSEAIAPATRDLGVMLPYSPLHTLLVERTPLVLTSGNISDEPIVRTNREAWERLRSVADAFLIHNREIHMLCDDSVMRIDRDRLVPIRRSRGYAPLPVRLITTGPGVLATGGELKSTFCLTQNEQALVSPHLGDLSHVGTFEAFRRSLDHFLSLFEIHPEIIACDLNPSSLSSEWARGESRRCGLRLVEVQHHHAHIASVLAEHRIDLRQRVIGVSLDGTGYGPDGTTWGGEFLIASCAEYFRWAHLKPIALPGGDVSVRHPFRSALAHLWAAGLDWDTGLPCVSQCSADVRKLLRRQLERNLNCHKTSSMGRLFDAVSALLGIRQSTTYEGQAAMELEGLSDPLTETKAYSYSISDSVPHKIDPGPMLEAICADIMNGRRVGEIASRFHQTIAYIIVDVCERARRSESLQTVALSGGVFQNRLLAEQTISLLQRQGFTVLVNRTVPCNDGGLSLGQAIVAVAVNSA